MPTKGTSLPPPEAVLPGRELERWMDGCMDELFLAAMVKKRLNDGILKKFPSSISISICHAELLIDRNGQPA